MASIELDKLTKRFGSLVAVNQLSLEIKDKEFVALLGPSGCGKTTTMNMIAGIEQPSAGAIRFDGADVRRLPAGRRRVGFVFQNYAIFTHLSVYENLAFGLRVRRLDKREVDRRVREMADLMRLTERLDWRASRLSVNELQKVAIGRSAITEPAIFLLDEPLSNLDAAFRAFMRTELKHLQHEFQQTMVYVTHDQIEAMSLADRVAVMDLGLLQQYGTPLEVYNRPRNTFVARFMGSPSMNLLRCRLAEEAGRMVLDFGPLGRARLEAEPLVAQARAAPSAELFFGVRPEDVDLARPDEPGLGLPMSVAFVEPIGPRTVIHLRADRHDLKVAKGQNVRARLGEAVKALFVPERCRLFDAASGLALDAIGA